MSFAARAASQNWETLPLGGAEGSFFWGWFKPANIPQGAVLRISAETFQALPDRRLLTLRNLLQSAGLDIRSVPGGYIYGRAFDGSYGASPLFDQPLAPPLAGGDPNIVVFVDERHLDAVPSMGAVPPTGVVPPMGAVPPVAGIVPAVGAGVSIGASPENSEEAVTLLERIDGDWQATLQLESQVTRSRKNLADILNRLKTLNRDLSPEERLHGNRQDKSDWEGVRRWLRELANRVSRCIKDVDIGESSNAGRRKRFQELYDRHVVPRQSFAGLAQTQREFEAYRKLVQSLEISMTSALASARQDGENRARQVLNRIAAGIRQSKSKR